MFTKQLGSWSVSGVNKFDGEDQGKIHHVLVAEEKVTPFPKGKKDKWKGYTKWGGWQR